MSNELQEYTPQRSVSVFSDAQAFELAQRKAKALAESDLVPTNYKGKVANCLVALEIADRVGASVMAVMQNMALIHGKPSWSSTYVIATVNSLGRFEPLRFDLCGAPGKDDRTCIAWTTPRGVRLSPEVSTLAKARAAGIEVIEGPPVSIAMAKAEGWYGKSGSKWQTMPELMLQYRAGSWFGRLYASEKLLGMRTEDEEREIIDVTPNKAVADVNEKIRAGKKTKAKEPEQVSIPKQDADGRWQTAPATAADEVIL